MLRLSNHLCQKFIWRHPGSRYLGYKGPHIFLCGNKEGLCTTVETVSNSTTDLDNGKKNPQEGGIEEQEGEQNFHHCDL